MKLAFTAVCLIALLISSSLFVQAENWNQWRGPNANGITSQKELPLEWSAEKNVFWKIPLGGRGNNTPIIWDDRIFLTGQKGSGPVQSYRGMGQGNPRGDQEVTFVVQCFNKDNGSVIWEKEITAAQDREAVHPLHNLATPSIVTDGEHVIAWFGTGQLFCYDLDGNEIWNRNLAEEISPFKMLWAHGSSPVLHDEFLYLLCDHDPKSYLLAVDKSTGEKIWEADHGRGRRSYGTPLVINTGEREELIVNSNPHIVSYDPKTGEQLWTAGEFIKVPVPMPVFHEGILYTSRGYRNGPYMALQPGGSGDVTNSHTEWMIPVRAPYVSSLLYYQDLLYMASEEGMVMCVDPKSGEPVWTKKYDEVFWASPVAGDGKIYITSEAGNTYVFAPGNEFKELAVNTIGEKCMASPAFSDRLMYIRGEEHLFCIHPVPFARDAPADRPSTIYKFEDGKVKVETDNRE